MLNSSKSGGGGDSPASTTKSEKKSKNKNKKISDTANESLNGDGPPIESAKEAKEKKDSWVKTIGMRTLRLRKSTDSRSSRLSIPSFSSLDRPGKNKKNKDKTTDSLEGNETPKDLKPDKSNSESQIKCESEHVKVPKTLLSGASSFNGITSKDNTSTLATSSDVKQASSGEILDKQDPSRFLGEGLTFKGKLIGVLEVSGPRGDRICQEALSELKIAVKAAGEHKQKITIHIALDGLRIRDEKTGDCLYHHQVHKISFIAQDLTDTRAFGYIFGSPDTGHRFFGIKTEKSASQVVIAMRDLFQVVFDLKKKEIERAKQQLEMQQKFLATRAAETAPPSKPEPKFSIAETYIEGACAMGSSTVPPNRSAPEVDLLNLEVELTSLQEGLDSIHHNLAETAPFRGSTTSISSDPMNPMPKRSSVSSANTNNTTPIPAVFNNAIACTADPFGDSFDPSSISSVSVATEGFKRIGSLNASSRSNSALTSPFSADPFANVDPFPDSKFNAGAEFFASDPFESPSGPFSFTFPTNDSISANNTNQTSGRASESGVNSNTSFITRNSSASAVLNHSSDVLSTRERRDQHKISGGWTASFEDDFVPDPESGPMSGFSADLDIFTELDPLGTGRTRPFVDRKDFFNDLKHPPKKGMNETSTDLQTFIPPLSSVMKNDSLQPDVADGFVVQTVIDTIPNSFSTNFNPSSVNNNSGIDFDSHFKTAAFTSFKALKSESPPNYSPPPPPRSNQTGSSLDFYQSASIGGGQILPPPSTNSPSASMRLLNKKSPQILKQLTISESSTSPKTLPRYSKQFTLDSSTKDDIPNLSPPPRPPHSNNTTTLSPGSTGLKANSKLSAAVPRPSSGSSGERFKTISSTGAPEPPPRPLPTISMLTSPNSAHHQMQVTSPPPLPPKKHNLNTSLSNPLGSYKPPFNNDSRSMMSNASTRSSLSEANDLPLPTPLRKTHTNTLSEHNSNNTFVDSFQTSGGRYSVPLNNSQPPLSLSGSPSLGKRDNLSTKSNSSMDSTNSNQGSMQKLSMEHALVQVASLSLGDLAKRLELPVDKLSTLTIQQLAEKMTEIEYKSRKSNNMVIHREKNSSNVIPRSKQPSSNSSKSDRYDSNFGGFDDDFSTASAPQSVSSSGPKNTSGYDRYAVFRELAVEDASGFSIINGSNSDLVNNSSMFCNIENNSEDEDEDISKTQDKTMTSRDSSSERTLQADDITIGGSILIRNASVASSAIALANTMDDVTDLDLNLSDDQEDNGKFPEDEDDLTSGFINKPEWATFESNFDDQFCTTALAEGSNESPSWESDVENGDKITSSHLTTENYLEKDGFNFKPFEKPSYIPKDELIIRSPLVAEDYEISDKNLQDVRYTKKDHSPDPIRSPPGQFRRQSSGSSRHSERSSGGGHNNGGVPGKSSDFSDSGKPNSVHTKGRKGSGSKDYGRWDERGVDRDREGSGRYIRDRDYGRSDSRNSYSSMQRKYHQNSDEEFGNGSSSIRRSSGSKGRVGSGRREREYDRERGGEVEIEDEDDRSYASHHSNYSSGGPRRHKRYPPKHYHHPSSSRVVRKVSGSGVSPDRYSNHESDESFEDENGSYSRREKRDRDYYTREREYYDRHHRHRPTSSTGVYSVKRHSRDSPRHSDSYYKRDNRRGGRPRNEEDDESRDQTDYSGEEREEYYSRGTHHGSHRRIRNKRSFQKEKDTRDTRKHYYTNSPSWDSESGHEGGAGGKKEYSPRGEKSSSRPPSGKYNDETRRGGSPELSKHSSSGRRDSGGRRYQSELALNSKSNVSGGNDMAKLTAFNFTEDFGPSSLPPENTNAQPNSLQTSDQLSSLSPTHEKTKSRNNEKSEKLSTSSGVNEFVSCSSELPVENKNSQSHSPFEDDFVAVAKNRDKNLWEGNENGKDVLEIVMGNGVDAGKGNQKVDSISDAQSNSGFPTTFGDSTTNGGDELGNLNQDIFPPTNDSKVFPFTGRRLESIKSEEEKSNDDSHSHSASESAVQMKKSDSFNIFKQRADDPFGDDDFFA